MNEKEEGDNKADNHRETTTKTLLLLTSHRCRTGRKEGYRAPRIIRLLERSATAAVPVVKHSDRLQVVSASLDSPVAVVAYIWLPDREPVLLHYTFVSLRTVLTTCPVCRASPRLRHGATVAPFRIFLTASSRPQLASPVLRRPSLPRQVHLRCAARRVHRRRVRSKKARRRNLASAAAPPR